MKINPELKERGYELNRFQKEKRIRKLIWKNRLNFWSAIAAAFTIGVIIGRSL